MVTPLQSVSERIIEAIQNDPRTKGTDIDAAFSQGAVTLTGTVKSVAILQAVEEIARNQPGVVTVINELKVR